MEQRERERERAENGEWRGKHARRKGGGEGRVGRREEISSKRHTWWWRRGKRLCRQLVAGAQEVALATALYSNHSIYLHLRQPDVVSRRRYSPPPPLEGIFVITHSRICPHVVLSAQHIGDQGVHGGGATVAKATPNANKLAHQLRNES